MHGKILEAAAVVAAVQLTWPHACMQAARPQQLHSSIHMLPAQHMHAYAFGRIASLTSCLLHPQTGRPAGQLAAAPAPPQALAPAWTSCACLSLFNAPGKERRAGACACAAVAGPEWVNGTRWASAGKAARSHARLGLEDRAGGVAAHMPTAGGLQQASALLTCRHCIGLDARQVLLQRLIKGPGAARAQAAWERWAAATRGKGGTALLQHRRHAHAGPRCAS